MKTKVIKSFTERKTLANFDLTGSMSGTRSKNIKIYNDKFSILLPN